MKGPWRLQLLGEFRLVRPDGSLATIKMRKAQGLIVILASSPTQSLNRLVLQEALWPESHASHGQASLRQALAQVRKAISPDFVIATRELCRIGPGFDLVIEDSESIGSDTYLPDFPEPWFERERQRRFGEIREPSAGAPLITGLLTLLRWYAQSDPNKTLAMMRDHVEIVEGIAPRELYPLVESGLAATRTTDSLYGWGMLWKGTCLGVFQNIAASEPFLHCALQIGVEHDDIDLLIRASCVLACNQAIRGQRTGAAKTLSRIEQLWGAKTTQLGMFEMARGAILHHLGQTAAGTQSLQRGLDAGGLPPTEQNRFQALLAVFLSTTGNSHEAMDLIAGPDRFARETSNALIPLLVKLVNGQVLLNEGCPAQAAKILDDLAREASKCRSTHLELYAHESLALASWRTGDVETARSEIRKSQHLRSALGFGFTQWDRGRLSELSLGNSADSG